MRTGTSRGSGSGGGLDGRPRALYLVLLFFFLSLSFFLYFPPFFYLSLSGGSILYPPGLDFVVFSSSSSGLVLFYFALTLYLHTFCPYLTQRTLHFDALPFSSS
ncbi:hypothetical protein C8R43DRAFT_94279 [Mycena crocata]|nr:hypothetical protein C8R43DRAFT_94279 [Mycena crocata]